MARRLLAVIFLGTISMGAAFCSEFRSTDISTTTSIKTLSGKLWLEQRISRIAQQAEGKVGVAGLIIETGDTFGLNVGERFPMQSVYKLPIAMAVLQQVDEEVLSLDQTISVVPEDYVSEFQHSPIRDSYPGGTKMTIRELLEWMLKQSDGSACDVLLRIGGGTERVRTFLNSIGTTGVVVLNTEKEIGSDEDAQFANYAIPAGIVGLLKSAYEGDGLSSSSRQTLLKMMEECQTGRKRLKGLLPEGTNVAHKTGGSRTVDGITAATNDVGIITLPNGRHLAIAVFVSDAKADSETRERVIAEIARAAYDAVNTN